MKKDDAFFLWPALFFLAGCVSFASIPWVQRFDQKSYQAREPYFKYPVIVFSGRALLRNDAFGKGAFGVSRNAGHSHEGIDLLTPLGNPIFASKSGRVAYAGEGKGYGLYVEIHHPDGTKTRYAHLSKIQPLAGDWVSVGQLVGLCGKTGNADDSKIMPHLHFEIRKNGHAVDPSAGQLDPSILVR